MTYFSDILTPRELKSRYRKMATKVHPDKGGMLAAMQKLNEEYSMLLRGFSSKPVSLNDIMVGNTVYVNKSECIVTEVEGKLFKAKALESKREAYFDKSTGYALFNFRLRAHLLQN